MKRYSKQLITSVIFIIILFSIPSVMHAQIGDPPADPGTDPDAPIDGGVSVLLAAGVGYGIKKYRNTKRKNFVHYGKETAGF
ncbi:MAG: hypothetical protein QM791_02595 [Ferruginibacter sp.]